MSDEVPGGEGQQQPEPAYEFDVALSYSGEDRSYVHSFAEILRKQGIRVFYDEFFTAELWGQDLYVYLDTVYRTKSRFTVVFISQSYVAKPWPSHERQSAQARALNEMGPYLLPVRFDDSVLPGLRPTVSFIDARNVTPGQLAELAIDKLADAPGVVASTPTMTGVPRTVEEQHRLLNQRPPGWEFLYYASVLLRRRAGVEDKWRDHEIRYAVRTGKRIEDTEIVGYLLSAVDEATTIVEGVGRVLDSAAQEQAFGEPGEPGHPERIEHLATRLIGVYEELLDWARDLRGINVSSELRNTFELAARLVDLPARQIRDFVDVYVVEAERITARLLRSESVYLELPLKLDMDNESLSEFVSSLRKIKKKFKN